MSVARSDFARATSSLTNFMTAAFSSSCASASSMSEKSSSESPSKLSAPTPNASDSAASSAFVGTIFHSGFLPVIAAIHFDASGEGGHETARAPSSHGMQAYSEIILSGTRSVGFFAGVGALPSLIPENSASLRAISLSVSRPRSRMNAARFDVSVSRSSAIASGSSVSEKISKMSFPLFIAPAPLFFSRRKPTFFARSPRRFYLRGRRRGRQCLRAAARGQSGRRGF